MIMSAVVKVAIVVFVIVGLLASTSQGLTAKISPKSLRAFWNDYVIFKCHVSGIPSPTVTWYNNDRDIMLDQRSTIQKISGGYMLRFGKLHPRLHNGTMSCTARNGVDQAVSDSAIIHVASKRYDPSDPSLPLGYPRILATYNPDIHVVVGTSITLVVNVTGNPQPTITWFRDKKFLDASNPRLQLLSNNSLHIRNIQLADIGRYDYMAENEKGNIFSRPWTVTAFLLKTKPVFVPGLRDKVVDPQTDVELNCTATGYPTPKTEWEDSRVNSILRNGPILVILNIVHTATYKCNAYNAAGTASISVRVVVREVPFAPINVVETSKTGDSITISWQEGNLTRSIGSHLIKYRQKGDPIWFSDSNLSGGSTSWTISDLEAYTDYMVQVFSVNSLGTSKGSVVVTFKTDETAPSTAPRNILVKATGKTSIEVSWQAPLSPNGQITSYNIYYTDDPSRDYKFWKTLTASRSPMTIHRDLYFNRRYAVAISATTATGSGPLSKHHLVQTLKGAPSDPQNVQVKVVDSKSVQVSWSKPVYNGGGQGIVGYEVFYNTSGTSLDKKLSVQSPDDFSRTIPNLRPYTAYQFAVAAKTDAGSGPISSPQLVTTTEDVPSGAPTSFSCAAVSSTSLTCDWQPPEVDSRNGRIIGYRITYKAQNQEQHSTKDVSGSTRSLPIFGLQPYTSYGVRVAAKTSLGTGPFSIQIDVTTDEDTPSKPPENLKAEVVNSTAIHVTWEAPSSPFGAKLLGYTVYYRRFFIDADMKRLDTTDDRQEILLNELQPETEYEIRVAIRSAKGIGKVSQALRVKTKQSPPQAPIFTSIKKLPSPQLGVRLNWSSSAREIEKYRLRYTKHVEKIVNVTLLKHKARYIERNFSRSQTSFTYTNFEHGLWYNVRLSVRNPGGWSNERAIWLEMDATKPTGPPLNLRVQPRSSTSLQISWDLPDKWKRNGEIIGYRLSYMRAGFTEERQDKNVDKKTTIVIKSLARFTTYSFLIRAKTKVGEGPAAEIIGKTKQDAPSTPPNHVKAQGVGRTVVLVKFSPPSTPNGVITGYKVLVYLDYPKSGVQPWKWKEIDEDVREMYIGELLRESDYIFWFKIAAKTAVGLGPYSPPFTAKLLTFDLPLPVRKLSIRQPDVGKVELKWLAPFSTTAVRKYQIIYGGEKTFRGEDRKMTTIRVTDMNKTVECCRKTSVELDDLEPNMKYFLSIVSASLSRKSEVQHINFTTKVGPSPSFSTPNVNQTGITKQYIPINLFGASERNGPISYYLVVVAALGGGSWDAAAEKLKEIQNSPSDGRSRHGRSSEDNAVYVTGKLPAHQLPTTFNVGQGQHVNGFSNKKLTAEHFYAFAVKSCVIGDDSNCLMTVTSFTDVVQFTPGLSAAVIKEPSNQDDSIGFKLWVLGPIVGIVLLLIVAIAICLLWRRRRSNGGKRQQLNALMMHDEDVPMMTSPKDPVDFHRSNLKTEGMRSHPPIHISELAEHIEELHANNNHLFTREYESIDPGMTFLSEVSARHLNQSKNRYPNIVPYDHTRVILQETSGFLDSDYINANVVAGYRNQNAYIASQAPLSNTINDFWQMVWEQETRTIVMMTNIKEKGRTKCDQYWPRNGSEKFGDISVAVVETLELAHYSLRTFRLCKDGQFDQAREVKHFQYTAWPEHGVPYYTTSLLSFIRKVRLSNPSDAGPVVVHCSAGVGRTAVFIVVDSMLERIRREQTVDVYGHVTLLRSQRNHMVQTEDQYIFIHETLLEAVQFGNTEIQASDLSIYFKKLNEIGEMETTIMEDHFKLLNTYENPHKVIAAALPVNKTKNRFPKILPYEHSRVDLVPVRGIDGSNYINASYIDGYKQRRAYIAAQGPLDDTVNDFWRMIMEKKSNIIVMLSGTTENDQEMSAEYWPTEKSAKYHFYIVDPVSVEETPHFTLRQFKVNDMMGACPSLIKLFQLREWPESGKAQGCKEIVDLIGQVHTARNNDENKGPVVVHCSSGSGRTGVFCALSIVVERMRAEGVVDLLQTVRQLRQQRPDMVETLEQYSFCYESALQYLSSFDHIA